MLRLFEVTDQDSASVTFQTEEFSDEDLVAYVMYDTSTGVTNLQDYYAWRTTNIETSSGDAYVLVINDSTKYPRTSPAVSNYNVLDNNLFKIMTLTEYQIIQMLLTRIDLIRKRFPNPGVTVNDVDYVGQGGTVSFSGGWDKKFSLEELRQMVEGTLIELNVHPPHTSFYWEFGNTTSDVYANPYTRTGANATSVPYEMVDLIVQGAVIRCLVAWGILEIDINFSTSDAGLTITYERVGHIASWMQNLLNEYKAQKEFIKMHYVNSYGIGVGTMPFGATGLWGMMLNQVTGPTGITPLSSMLGFGIRSNVPL